MKKARELYLLETLEGPWQEISINIIRPLSKSKDKNIFVVIVDQFTKMIRLKVTITIVSCEDITKIYQDNIWKLHGVPQKVLSNRGPQFTSKFIKDLMKALGTKRVLSMVYHLQTNGQMEQINQEVEAFL